MGVVKPKKKETEEWFKNLLDVAISEGQELWGKPQRYLRASGVGDKCIRSLALGMLGHKVPYPARTLRIFETGNAIEKVIIATLKKAKVLDSEQGKVEIDNIAPKGSEDKMLPFIRGSYDAVIKINDKKLLLEIKSINEFDFQKLPPEHGFVMAGDSPLMERYSNYIHQWNTYSCVSNTPDEGMILFEAKNTQNHKTYFLKHDQLLFSDLLYTLEEPWLVALGGEIPSVPRTNNPDDPKDKGCGRCKRRYLCKELPSGKIDLKTIKEKDGELRG